MKKFKTLLILLIFGLSNTNCNGQSKTTNFEPNIISFVKTDYGLIFTTININDKEVKAMIDFGDQHILQLSSTLTSELNIETAKAGYQVSDVYGNTWDVKKGTVQKFVVGTWEESNVEFTSQKGEMEAVSKQIGTEFHAVLGWGYFSRYFTEIDYSNSTFTVSHKRGLREDVAFSLPFNKDTNQLIFEAQVKGQKVNVMIDTGSPVSVVDPKVLEQFEGDQFAFKLQNEQFKIKAYAQDLSVLADLGVICILGGDFLDDLKIVIDFEQNLLHFKK